MRNANTPVTRNADDVCSGVFKLTTKDYGLDQPVLGGQSSSKEQPEPAVTTSQTLEAQAQSAEATPQT
jgi:hypothetical protein